MRKLRRTLVGLTIIAGIVFLALCQSEPRHQGRTLSSWLDTFNRQDPLDPDSDAGQAIRAIGAKSVPYLISNIRTQEVTLWKRLLVRLQSDVGIDFGFDRGRSLRYPSIYALHLLGDTASNAVPALVELYAKAEEHNDAPAMALLALGAQAQGPLEDLIEKLDAPERGRAAGHRAMCAATHGPCFPFETIYRVSATHEASMLVLYPKVTDCALEALRKQLKHPSPAVRQGSIEVIDNLWLEVPWVEGELRRACNDASEEVRETARRAVTTMDAVARGRGRIPGL